MIASLSGKLESLSADGAVINVGGIGFRVYMPTSDLTALGSTGKEVKVYTHLHLREDNVSLYAFASADALWLFETLLGVSGLGPRLVLAVLSALSVEQTTTAIATGNADILEMVPGIGRKVAGRIILELKEKIGAGWVSVPTTQAARDNTEVLAALTALGYSAAEAAKAAATVPADGDLSLEEKIKTALQYFGGQ